MEIMSDKGVEVGLPETNGATGFDERDLLVRHPVSKCPLGDPEIFRSLTAVRRSDSVGDSLQQVVVSWVCPGGPCHAKDDNARRGCRRNTVP